MQAHPVRFDIPFCRGGPQPHEEPAQGLGGIEVVIQGGKCRCKYSEVCLATQLPVGGRVSLSCSLGQFAFRARQFAQGFLGGVQRVEGEVELLPVVRTHQHVATLLGAEPPLRQVIDCVQIPQRFGHLGTIDQEKGGVKPVQRELPVTGAA